jgi:hypothetical protein
METTNQSTAKPLPTSTPAKKRSIRLKFGYIILLIVIIGFAITSFVFYKKYSDLRRDPQLVANQETKAVTADVGKHIELPKDETPTIATVQDKNKLKDQPFFASVENGDKILIYTKARKAIVYRPNADKVINVGPIAINNQDNKEIKQGTSQ